MRPNPGPGTGPSSFLGKKHWQKPDHVIQYPAPETLAQGVGQRRAPSVHKNLSAAPGPAFSASLDSVFGPVFDAGDLPPSPALKPRRRDRQPISLPSRTHHPARRFPRGAFSPFPIGTWNIVSKVAMFQFPHFVSDHSPQPWNRPFPKGVHRVSRKTAEISLFQLRNHLLDTSPPKSGLLYTCMTSSPDRDPANPMRWFTHASWFSDEPPHKGFPPVSAFTTLDGELRVRRTIDAGGRERDRMRENNHDNRGKGRVSIPEAGEDADGAAHPGPNRLHQARNAPAHPRPFRAVFPDLSRFSPRHAPPRQSGLRLRNRNPPLTPGVR